MIGPGGMGLHKLSYVNGADFLDEQPSTTLEILKLIENWKLVEAGYLLTEYLTAHPSLRTICGQSSCSLRVVVIRPAREKARIAYAYI